MQSNYTIDWGWAQGKKEAAPPCERKRCAHGAERDCGKTAVIRPAEAEDTRSVSGAPAGRGSGAQGMRAGEAHVLQTPHMEPRAVEVAAAD